jgi:anti-sigma-K factor RskA
MTKPGDPDSIDEQRMVLAGEIALGLVDATQVAEEMARDPLLAAEISRWDERIAAIALEAPAVAADPRVLTGLMAAVAQQTAADAAHAPSSVHHVKQPKAAAFLQSLAFWRGMSAAGFAAAAITLSAAFLPRAVTLPVQPDGTIARSPQVLLVSQILPKDGPPEYVATFDISRGRLVVVPAATLPNRSGIPFLWLVPNDDADPIGLGALDPLNTVNLDLAASALPFANEKAGLVITLEPVAVPSGGTAQGPVLAHGKFSSH